MTCGSASQMCDAYYCHQKLKPLLERCEVLMLVDPNVDGWCHLATD